MWYSRPAMRADDRAGDARGRGAQDTPELPLKKPTQKSKRWLLLRAANERRRATRKRVVPLRRVKAAAPRTRFSRPDGHVIAPTTFTGRGMRRRLYNFV